MIHYEADDTVWKSSIVGVDAWYWVQFTRCLGVRSSPNQASGRISQCVWLNEVMAKSFWRHYDINNLTQDYRKKEAKETMALEVVTDGKNNKTEKND